MGMSGGSRIRSFFLSLPLSDVHLNSFESLDFHICEFIIYYSNKLLINCLTLNVIPQPLILVSNMSRCVVVFLVILLSNANAALTKFLIKISLILSIKSTTTCNRYMNVKYNNHNSLHYSNLCQLMEDVILLDSSFLHIHGAIVVFFL